LFVMPRRWRRGAVLPRRAESLSVVGATTSRPPEGGLISLSTLQVDTMPPPPSTSPTANNRTREDRRVGRERSGWPTSAVSVRTELASERPSGLFQRISRATSPKAPEHGPAQVFQRGDAMTVAPLQQVPKLR